LRLLQRPECVDGRELQPEVVIGAAFVDIEDEQV
jgi:hypothetical protein